MSTTTLPTFEYGISRLSDLRIPQHAEPNANKGTVNVLELEGRPVRPGKRFWHSLQLRFGFTHNIFRYFTHAEVFDRISAKANDDQLRWCLEVPTGKGLPTLQGITGPRGAVVRHDDLMDLIQLRGHDSVKYADGVIRSQHSPRYAPPYSIGGDQFESKFVIDTPIDGFGKPAIYLAMLRQICTNGAVAYAASFRSELNVGKGQDGATFAIERAMEGFNNEEGFAAMRQRFESATGSWASVGEVQDLYKTLIKLQSGGHVNTRIAGDGLSATDGTPLMRQFRQTTGDLEGMYGVANFDRLSQKRQRMLPSACRVYDLLNFTSELATHHADENGARALQAHLGTLISGEYDLEGTADQFADWRDFFIKDANAIDTISTMR